MARALADEPLFPIADIQGDILVGLRKKNQKLLFFTISDPPSFATFLRDLRITSMEDVLAQIAVIDARHGALLPTPGLNVAFTHAGLVELGVDASGAAGAEQFVAGMAASRSTLADPDPGTWTVLGRRQPVHGVFLVTGASEAEVDDVIALRLAPVGSNGWTLVHTEVGKVRPVPVKGHEHFGYADGVSQPAVRGRIDAATFLEPQDGPKEEQAQPGRDLLWPGEFLFGYPELNGVDLATPSADPKAPPVPFMENGAFLVFRRLAQKVPEFDLAVKEAAAALAGSPGSPSPELLGAQMVGRWKSGAPLINAPTADDPLIGDGNKDVVNDFEFEGDRQGLVCPFAAHIRKAYPRDEVPFNIPFDPDPPEDLVASKEAFTQTHRMLRRGIAFGPELTAAEAMSGATTEQRGLLFACYVTDIADQFEFVQSVWVNNANFSQPGAGSDAIIGQGPGPGLPFVGGAPVTLDPDDKPHLTFGRFVHMQGGEYFFAPSIPALRGLAE